MRIGLISDTHGLWRPEASRFLEGCSLIVHAGDIGSRAVLEALRGLAPLCAVRGNNDDWAGAIPETQSVEVGGVGLYVVHDCNQLRAAPAGARVLIVGHSHRPAIERRDGMLLINPGSAGPRRFKLPVAAGEIVIGRGVLEVRIVDLLSGSALPGLSATWALGRGEMQAR
ncbi:MAG TPA: metallophosphoesterase family protein [Steroidobacteraceae bacterium]|nr:metallophosphoesterase family protein [Steroidobacteraceae bacterium]